ncbi:pimeloyl-ACP methyl ester carboxylesterase [Halopolyspora algeriensis]|uniref:Pimeloyl-ACP methyl ester carboxylesterase n=1 Tax=Halopolyspora algeriensis TaxID=1500506 RepID=A0A368VS39_9ACTN|nr:alpha/beta hydrolase [Halopolyspora algeriensis]RCW43662.1 pimeloyl-ACP methyl ester carboxylesterase [Halopolyspora algeriensis]TQM47555.1 pimeloyl-ACP methyl ester carboxylesterase [Halopolyspora algeriensis]
MSSVNGETGPVEHTVRLGGSDLHYWVYGAATTVRRSDARAPVVMIHGLRGTHHGLELIAEHFPERTVVIPDLPGFGDSGPMRQRQHDVEGYAQLVTELVEHLGGRDRPVLLLGHSFGSLVAARAARLAPEPVWRLVLVNPISTPALRGPRVVLSRLTSVYYRLGKALPPRVGRALLSNRGIVLAASAAMVRSRDKRVRRFVHGSHLRYFSRFHSPALLSETYEASVTHTVAEYAAGLDTPTLLIAGAEDDIAPVHGQRRLAAELTDAELTVIPDVGHLVHYETPVAASRAIQRFLDAREEEEARQ